MKKYISKSMEDTKNLGEKLGKLLKKGDIVLLYGDLGSGKTVFAKGIGKGLGIEGEVTSPTFTLVNEYHGREKFYHFDLYRIDDYAELYEIGYEEYFYNEAVCAVEWPERLGPLIPKERLEVLIEKGEEEDLRIITLNAFGKRYEELLKEMD
ncbi:tRNA threonylcarbamoyladenosine biosynthesis protein TsaE [Caldanaerobacter subterraneus subsp. tengcongensis MB4]|uniref:tRNA threonylcarbamoyladenosine biosynthesis protein TsaE n=1 Tax=Caldanaerobacter subterraneus subsp. tengcongensis (strain DSM 15242 / JCM 11007 / NBRC 100824 / MB4) TaxID=273068 RepID=Q8RCA1_CALS4|nr:tRNA (adenosine(37)-N6)-threonylcarbamoyltransferase complex ATPase subunit type 1 TsaE [Caldanaerobacter subterraneus]AAM23811.1 predicted ATPase or kinase [Caldanaerobacter subterraneus subsp. tengcongensis MB4]MCS3916689.1 tRNA threonylcarbamoyladenosine biosynthesis protein TsaE [Caldanaerobacter subterraneus subsp. tengcongensis MB4]